MKRDWKQLGMVIGLLLIVGGLAWAAVGEPYVEYQLEGFTDVSTVPSNLFIVGIETPAVFGGLTFDVSLFGRLASTGGSVVFTPGSRFVAAYGTSDTYLSIGCLIDGPGTFGFSIGLKLTFDVFGGLSGDAGGL